MFKDESIKPKKDTTIQANFFAIRLMTFTILAFFTYSIYELIIGFMENKTARDIIFKSLLLLGQNAFFIGSLVLLIMMSIQNILLGALREKSSQSKYIITENVKKESVSTKEKVYFVISLISYIFVSIMLLLFTYSHTQYGLLAKMIYITLNALIIYYLWISLNSKMPYILILVGFNFYRLTDKKTGINLELIVYKKKKIENNLNYVVSQMSNRFFYGEPLFEEEETTKEGRMTK